MNKTLMNKTMTSSVLVAFGLLSASIQSEPATAADWGGIKGRFVVDGAPPKVPPLVVTKDQFCIDTMPVNKTVVVGEDGGLANAVVFIRLPRRGTIESHPDFEAQLSEPAVLDNKGCSFEPHITLVRVGQPLVIKNSDPVGHNTNAKFFQNASFNVLIAEGQESKVDLSKGEPMPMPVNCNIHPFMQGHILVQDHPYMAASAEDGTFEIENIPVGEHEFQFWHEAPGNLRNLKLQGATANRQGRAKLKIAAGQTLDLGEIKVPASVLK